MGMKRLIVTTCLFVFGLGFCAPALLKAQPNAVNKIDERAENLVALGKRYLKTGNYLDAALSFEHATERPKNRLSSISLYYAGLSYYFVKEHSESEKYFKRLGREYPRSQYLDDARYHRALISLEKPGTNDREKGLDQLFRLMKETRDAELKNQILESLRYFMYEVLEPKFLNYYYIFLDDPYQHLMVEALCHKWDKQGDAYAVLKRIEEYESSGQALSPYLKELKAKYSSGKQRNIHQLKVALVLSFNLQLTDTAHAVPSKSKKSLEFYHGVKLALDSMARSMPTRIDLKVVDTQGDTASLQGIFEELEAFQPDVIIGEIRTSLVERIVEWSEKRQIVNLIPRNPIGEFSAQKRFAFLTHPSLTNGASGMANFLVKERNMKKFLVFNDHYYSSEKCAKGFTDAIEALTEEFGTSVTTKSLPFEYETMTKSLPKYIRTLKGLNYDAVYVPVQNEEVAGLIISELNYHKIKTQVVGSSNWEGFNIIDSDVKTRFNLLFPSYYFPKNDSLGMYDFRNHCLEQFYYMPSKYTVFGYDIMMFLLKTIKEGDRLKSIADLIREAPRHQGLHHDFYFDNQQGNIALNIVKFLDGRIDKVNWPGQE